MKFIKNIFMLFEKEILDVKLVVLKISTIELSSSNQALFNYRVIGTISNIKNMRRSKAFNYAISNAIDLTAKTSNDKRTRILEILVGSKDINKFQIGTVITQWYIEPVSQRKCFTFISTDVGPKLPFKLMTRLLIKLIMYIMDSVISLRKTDTMVRIFGHPMVRIISNSSNLIMWLNSSSLKMRVVSISNHVE